MRDSTTQTGSNRLEIPKQEVAVLLVLNPRANLTREGEMPPEIPLPPRDRVGAGQGLVCKGEREVLDPVLLARREGPDRVISRRLRSIEDRVDVRNLPLPDRAIHGGPGLTPMGSGTAPRVDHRSEERRVGKECRSRGSP